MDLTIYLVGPTSNLKAAQATCTTKGFKVIDDLTPNFALEDGKACLVVESGDINAVQEAVAGTDYVLHSYHDVVVKQTAPSLEDRLADIETRLAKLEAN